MKRTILIFGLFSFFFISLFAQPDYKAQLCETYLGKTRFDSEAPKGEIIFRFKEGKVARKNPWSKTYRQLLLSEGFKNTKSEGLVSIIHRDQSGDHLIQSVTKKISKSYAAPEPTPKPIQSPAVAKPITETNTITIIDSLTAVIKLMELQKKAEDGVQNIKILQKASDPFLRWLFVYISMGCIIVIVIVRFITSTISNETFMVLTTNLKFVGPKIRWVHDVLTGIGLVAIWIILIPTIVSVVLWCYSFFGFNGSIISILIMLICVWVISGSASTITDWLLPNIKTLGHDDGHGSGHM